MTIKFVLGFHNHQPVGNFDFVIEENYQKAYLPFIKVAKKYAKVKFALHTSGCLLEWYEKHHPEYFDLLSELVKRGQVELLGGGFYEPIFPAIPHESRIMQLKKMNNYLKAKFDVEVSGAWVTERVWEPQLARSFEEAGIKYVGLDDFHFGLIGLQNHRLRGYYFTEDEGHKVGVFPINQNLRYLIPFALIKKINKYVEQVRLENPEAMLICWDDGEKFGGWPKTHDWVYKERWLEKFFEYLSDDSNGIETILPVEAFNNYSALGRVYLPSASYQEMCIWALPPELGKKVEKAVKQAKKEGKFEEARTLYNAASWRNFLTKYEESDFMQKQGLFLHKKIKEIKNKMLKISEWINSKQENQERLENAENSLLKSQCNCAYWHGVFGGLYLPHLRRAIYENQIDCIENIYEISNVIHQASNKDRKQLTLSWQEDYDSDGSEEIIVFRNDSAFWIKPNRGGAIVSWEIFNQRVNLLSTLMRRFEAYHDAPVKTEDDAEEEEHETIHDIQKKLTPEQKDALVYDWHLRVFGLDHFYPQLELSEKHFRNQVHDIGDFVKSVYSVKKLDDNKWELSVSGHLFFDKPCKLLLTKCYEFLQDGSIKYNVRLKSEPASDELDERSLNLYPNLKTSV